MQKMNEVRIEKVTLNIGIGQGGERLENAKALLEKVSGGKAVLTQAKVRNPTFKIKPGDNIGTKITLRKQKAEDTLKRALDTLDFKLKEQSFDNNGNIAFGIHEYIDFPGIRYDPKIGMMGFDVCLTLKKAGKRVAERKIRKARLPKKQRVSKEEAMQFLKSNYKVEVIGKEEEE